MTILRFFAILFTEFHEKEQNMLACFIGHRNITKNETLDDLLKQTVQDLVEKGVTTFLFGSMSKFDKLSWEAVTALKTIYPFIKRIYVRSSYQHIDKSYENYLLESYEETYFPPKLAHAGKYSYVERNYQMIDRCTYCVFYYDKNYFVPLSKSKHNVLLQSKRNSGTKIAYQYAMKKNKIIINLYR